MPQFNHQYSGLEKDSMQHMQHKIAPAIKPNYEVSGNFSVRVISSDGVMARVELMIVKPDDHETVLHSFGVKDVLIGRPVTLEGLESTINFLPKGV